MSLTLRRAAAGITAVVLAGGALLTTGGAVHAATAPPWEPDSNSVGGLLFFNSAGVQITSGNTSDSPIAAYVEGAKTVRAGDDKATLFGYLPVKGQVPGQWQGEAFNAPTVYPNSSAPTRLKTATLPVESGVSGDETLADLAVDFPNADTSTDGYAGIYQLRLRTSSTHGGGLTPKYDSADIKISGSTWSVVYSNTQAASKTTLVVSPTSVFHGAAVKLTVTVSPSTAAGSVTFRNGSNKIGTAKVSHGKATLTTKALPDGTDKIKATFTPTNSTAFSPSTSAARSVKVKAHSTKVSLTASAASIKAGQKLTLTIKETPAVAGKVAIFDGAKKIGTVTVKKGKASFSTTKLKAGSHSLKAKFTPTHTQAHKASTSKIVKVKVTK